MKNCRRAITRYKQSSLVKCRISECSLEHDVEQKCRKALMPNLQNAGCQTAWNKYAEVSRCTSAMKNCRRSITRHKQSSLVKCRIAECSLEHDVKQKCRKALMLNLQNAGWQTVWNKYAKISRCTSAKVSVPGTMINLRQEVNDPEKHVHVVFGIQVQT